LRHAAPVGVDHAGALGAWPNAIAPVVFVGEAAARPAQHGHVDPAERLHHVVADAARVGNRRLLPDPDALVDTATQVLGKVPVHILVDPLGALIGIDDDASHRCIPSSLGGRARARSRAAHDYPRDGSAIVSRALRESSARWPSLANTCSRCRIRAGPAVRTMVSPYARSIQNRAAPAI